MCQVGHWLSCCHSLDICFIFLPVVETSFSVGCQRQFRLCDARGVGVCDARWVGGRAHSSALEYDKSLKHAPIATVNFKLCLV